MMRLRVTSIDPSMNKEKLVELFEEIGDVESIKVFRTRDNSEVAMALVVMKRDREGEEVVRELNGHLIGDTALRVEFSQDLVRSTGNKPKPPVIDDDDDENWEENGDIDPEEDLEVEEEEEERKEIPLDELDEEI